MFLKVFYGEFYQHKYKDSSLTSQGTLGLMTHMPTLFATQALTIC